MDKIRGETAPTFSQPIRQIVAMLVACLLVGSGAWFIHAEVVGIPRVNPLFNGFITAVFLLGVVTCFWQVLILVQSVSWIEDFVRHVPGHDQTKPPRLLAPLASLLRSRGARMQISTKRETSPAIWPTFWFSLDFWAPSSGLPRRFRRSSKRSGRLPRKRARRAYRSSRS